uniref:TMC domain-containing protein n=1 Tax=Bursaphelenchus xylophilus TaxID=6326 RepID=A0A1I7SB96_BURXY
MGYVRYSPLFYGYYSADEYDAASGVRYSLPLAYFLTILLVFGYSFFAILRKMASNASMSKLAGSKAEQYIFNWKLFTGWDYTIGNSETATNTVMAVIIKLRESIAESRVQTKEKFQCLRFSLRVFANMVILAMLAFSIYCISFAVQSSSTVETSSSLIIDKNQVELLSAGSQEKIIASEEGPKEVYNNQICWETMIGQQIVRLVMMDLYITIASIMVIDFLRGLWIRYTATWWCWDVENVFPEYGEFKVAENVLHIINNQGMVWLGLFFAPLLPAINNVKLIIFMYIRAWAVITCNVPAREIFRASRSSNFYLMILLLWLLLCTLPVGYVIASKQPSGNCGPFAGRHHFYDVITQLLEDKVDKNVLKWIRYVGSPGVVIPVLLLLMLIIYFLVSLVRGLREANTDLQQQLVHERTEEKKKIFELAGGGQKNKKNPFSRFTGNKSAPRKMGQHVPELEQKRREPWRAYNGRDNVASLCPTDEPPSSPNSPTSQQPSPPSFRKRSARPDEYYDDRARAIPKAMSLTSLNEDSDETKSGLMTKSCSATRNDRIDWSAMETIEQEKKEVRTPEEIRKLMAPLLSAVTGSALSLAQFPSEENVTVIFGNRSSLTGGKLRDSFVSLYDNEKSEISRIPQNASRSSLSKMLRSVDNVCLPFSMPQTSLGQLRNGESVPEHSQNISMYNREPRRLGQSPLASSASAPPRRFSYSQRESPQPPQPQRVEIKPRTDEFVPWPSIEEVRAQRAHLLPKNRDRPRPDTLRDRSSSIHRAETPSRMDEAGPSEAQPRRFRISVSPTRRLQEPEVESLPPAPSRPKFIIKQRVIPGSTLSMASTMTKLSSQPSTPSKPSTPIAPRVAFGADDSPRVEE